MLPIPNYVWLVFVGITIYAFALSVWSIVRSEKERLASKAPILSVLLVIWLMYQSTLALSGWYMDREASTPHILFTVIMNAAVFLLAFITPLGKKFMDNLNLKILIWVHLARIPTDLCLYWLAVDKQVPWSMTFQKYNFDIIFGITAPIFILLFLYRKKISKQVFLIWNILGLASMTFLLVRTMLATPTTMQVWDFDQPNYAILHFPFVWFPSFVATAVILVHLISIRRLVLDKPLAK